MGRASGIGGAFVPARDPVRLGAWYRDRFGTESAIRVDGLMLFAGAADAVDGEGGAVPDGWSVSLQVTDLDAMVEQLRAAGAAVEVAPIDCPGGRVACLRDPEANLVRLFEPAATSQVWSSDPAAVRALEAGQPAPAARRSGWRRWAPWLLLLLAAVLAVVFVAARRENTTAEPPPTRDPTISVPAATTVDDGVTVAEAGTPVLGVTAGWELIVQGHNTLSRVEFAAGRITTTKLSGAQGTGSASSMVAGPNWVIVTPDLIEDPGPGYLVPDGKPVRTLQGRLGVQSLVYPGPQPGQFWLSDTDAGPEDGDVSEWWLYTVTGKRVGPSMSVPASGNAAPDGAGYMLVSMTGGTYVVRPGLAGVHRVTTGRVDAVSRNYFLVTECDEAARCSRILISRTTGQRRTLYDDLVSPTEWARGAIAPDGSIAVVIRDDGLSVIDLATGRERVHQVLLRPGFPGAGVVFSPDSEWLFGITYDGDVVAIEIDTLHTHELNVQLPVADQLTIRPAS